MNGNKKSFRKKGWNQVFNNPKESRFQEGRFCRNK